ncbi:S8 family serine peptidase [Streptomyces sp. XM4193]|nr:S8 family serine peptidase [Streptomyces sp. XM4193]
MLFATATPAAADEVRENQWSLDYLNAEKAWQESTGKGVTVAVIDDGVDGSHADLERNVLEGKDFTGTGPAHRESTNDHGTAMAGIIAGHGHGANGSAGVKGIAPDAKILPIKQTKTGDDKVVGSYLEPVKYAVDQGAKIINMSFGTAGEPGDDDIEAIKYAAEHDVLLVASSGNSGSGNPYQPAVASGVLAVGAVDKNGEVWEDSNYGEHLMLTAPGVDMQVAAVTKPYSTGAGTSDAAAHVSGAAALIRAKYPDLTAGQVANRLVKTAKRAGSATEDKADPKYGYGIIQPYEALTADIPAGSKQGPLKTPDGGLYDDEAPKSPDQASGSDSDDDGAVFVAAAVIGVFLLLVLGVVLLVVRAKRKKRERQVHGGGHYPGPPPGQGHYGP